MIKAILHVNTKIEGEGVFRFISCRAERVTGIKHVTCTLKDCLDRHDGIYKDVQISVKEWQDGTIWLVPPPPSMLWSALAKIDIWPPDESP